MGQNFIKQTAEDVPFAIDFAVMLANENNELGDTIATSAWAVTPSGLTVVSNSIDSANTRTLVRVSGGTVGTLYRLINTITLTIGGYTLVDYITIRVTA